MPSKATNSKINKPNRADSMTTTSYNISDFFGENVFGPTAMEKFLSKAALKAVVDATKSGAVIDRDLADQIADGMKNWAMSKGATHYTHWFQPLRGTTAEKHDAFFEPLSKDSGVEIFSGKALVQQEPDASSFPSGGIRNTFEARGYTAWDTSSPAFIMEKAGCKTLCIPTIFISYTGEALDFKAPLLKALSFVKQASIDVCKYFDPKVKDCTISLGIEQEYFLVDSELFNQRPDLVMAGRTLIGASPAKGQQLEDHYFGSIPQRVLAFMSDFEDRAHRLGIPLKTRHNEVAPGQFECAPMFEDVNLAVDHNALLMDLMEYIAPHHGFRVLLHEKPFKGINGSGKHNNWSIITDTGVNTLSPGSSPEQNLQFLTFFINVIKAVHDNAEFLRASIATAGNDHRLGANEAPPAIVSIFIGDTLHHVLESFEKNKKNDNNKGSKAINISQIPEISWDNTDRNRTSPFAFTGNKFEFRAVGSSDNCAGAMIVLNTIMGHQLKQFKAEVDAKLAKSKTAKKEEVIKEVLRGYYHSSKNILFEGNGYGQEWVKEAASRGLQNIKTTPHALESFLSKKSDEVFVKNGIYTKKELEARTEINFENYTLKLQIEGRLLNEMVQNFIIPSSVMYQKRLADNVQSLLSIGQNKSSCKAQIEIISEISENINSIYSNNQKMINERSKANKIEDAHKKAIAYCEKVKPYFDLIRESADNLEQMVDDSDWSLPKYSELLFIK